MQSIRELAEIIAQFRTPPGMNWQPLADDVETALKAERERCAKIADDQSSKAPFGTTHEDEAYASGVERASEVIADAIRARDQPAT